jgi:uncharacterized protein (DUF1697 family)
MGTTAILRHAGKEGGRIPIPMTTCHIALLRGINVGKAKRVAMADLRTLVEGLGYGDVRTLLNSGNVVFSAPGKAADAASRIEKALAAQLGITARVTVLSAKDLAEAIDANPLGKFTKEPSRFLVTVLADPALKKKLLPLSKQDWKGEAIALGTRVAYLGCAPNILDSPLAKAVARALGDAATSRNWATMLKLRALAESVPRTG